MTKDANSKKMWKKQGAIDELSLRLAFVYVINYFLLALFWSENTWFTLIYPTFLQVNYQTTFYARSDKIF
jgi:hypothetical protein